MALIGCQTLLQALVTVVHRRFDFTCVILVISEEAVLSGLCLCPVYVYVIYEYVPDVVVPGIAVRAA